MQVMFSCVLDNNPTIAHQAHVWALSLLTLAKRKPEELVVHYIEPCEAEYLDRLRPLGVHLVPVKTFDPRHLPSNKLTQVENPLLAQADYVVLTDCDVAFAEDIPELFAGAKARAKIVDDANLEPSHWKAIYKAADRGEPALDVITTNDKRPTVTNFVNGGMIVLPRALYAKIGPVWARWNRWLLEHQEPLGAWNYYIDQVSFKLAMDEIGETVDPLPDIYNYPLHKFSTTNATPTPPKAIHYHSEVDASGYIQRTSSEVLNESIDKINPLVSQIYRSSFSNKSFWQVRYATRPDLGSGVGSRGHDLLVKRRLLQYVVEQLQPNSILDVGCGDLELTRELKIEKYTGTDISAAAIKIAKEKRPYWEFQAGDILELDLTPHDLVLCFDVTIHQPTEETYRRFCRRLQDLAAKYLIVAGYNQPPWFTSAITFFYEPLSQTLGLDGDSTLTILGGYRDTTAILWTRKGHPEWKDDASQANRSRPLVRRIASRVKREVIRRLKK